MDNIQDINKIPNLIIIIYILINIFYRDYTIIFIFIISLVLLTYIIGKYKENNLKIIAYSLLICFLLTLILGRRYNSMENFSNKKKKRKKKNTLSNWEDDTQDNFVGDNRVDIGTSFLDAYKNLDANQIDSMTKDTKNLIKTQKTLMSTLENLAPIVKEGKTIIDTFKGYFSKD